MSSQEPPPEFMKRVRARVFTWIGQALYEDKQISEEGWDKFVELYEQSFEEGLRRRIYDHQELLPPQKFWKELGGREYGRRMVRSMCRCVNALPDEQPVTPEQLQQCFDRASLAAKRLIRQRKERGSGEGGGARTFKEDGNGLPDEPIFC